MVRRRGSRACQGAQPGRTGVEQTLMYYREVEDRPQLRGTAFPSLATLVRGGTNGPRGTSGPQIGPNVSQMYEIIVEAPGIEPGSENVDPLLLRAYSVV
jgi:hypothetical protein